MLLILILNATCFESNVYFLIKTHARAHEHEQACLFGGTSHLVHESFFLLKGIRGGGLSAGEHTSEAVQV